VYREILVAFGTPIIPITSTYLEIHNMNKNLKMLYVFLSVFFLAAPLGIAASTHIRTSATSSEALSPASDFDFSNRRAPIDILVYNQYADVSPGGEYQNIMDAILAVYGQAFNYDNLSDYSQLGSRINNYDVLLIIEQENANSTLINVVAAAWSSFMEGWVLDGGIVICMGYYEHAYGQTQRILNSTGLMKLYNCTDEYHASSSITEPSDALAFGVTSPYTAIDGTVGFDTTEGVIVAEAGGKATVVHKMLGLGHVVMLGYDMYERGAAEDTMLANAIRLTRHAVFDNSHSQIYNPLSGYTDFASYICENYGFAITTMNVWDEALVSSCDVLVAGSGGTPPITSYSGAEINFIKNFVASGGGLLVETDWSQWGNNTVELLGTFGFARNYTGPVIADTDDNGGDRNQPIYGAGNIANHSATLGVSTIQMYYGNAFIAMPANAKPLVWTDSDGTAEWSGGGVVSNLPVAASLNYGKGRIIALADCDIFSDNNYDGDASDDFYDENNAAFAAGIMNWLSAAGIPEKTILLEQSHTPYFALNSIINSLYLLTQNGFNIRWESHFSEALINEADVVINVDGTVNWTAPEKAVLEDFLSRGGGLFLLCDWKVYGTQTNDLLAEYGMVLNGSTYLTDSDDGWVDGPPGSYIAYEGGDLGSHPILTGVHRIEIDRGCGFSSIGGGTVLVRTDSDGTAGWYGDGAANSVPVVVANTHGYGRFVVLADLDFLGSGDPDGDGYYQIYDSDNDVFIANIFYWLIENRAPIVHVVFPNGGEVLNGTRAITWTAVDPNIHDEMTYDVFISDNNGTDWTNLALGLSGLSYNWNTTLYDDGATYLVRVVASDGVLTGHDESDGVFELDNVAAAPFDPMLLIIIGIAAVGVIIVLVVLMKLKGSSKK
jgi:hypothetical protein